MSIASLLINRSLVSENEFKTPSELWFTKPSNSSNLRVFECVAVGMLVKESFSLEVKVHFLGYPEGVKGFKLWCPELKNND